MNLFETEIANYERRIKRIEQNPDPTRPAATKMLYEIWRDCRKQQLQDWQAGKPFVYGAYLPRLFSALGMHLIGLTVTGDRVHTQSREFLDLARRKGYPWDVCDRTQVGAGLALSGAIPPPAMVVNVPICDPWRLAHQWMGMHFGVPTYTIDIPREGSYEAVQYVAAQLEEMIHLAEQELPGVHFDQTKLVQLQERQQRMEQITRETLKYRKMVPCPVRARDSLRGVPYDLIHPKQMDYAQALRDEVRQRVQQGQAAVPGEKARIFWLNSYPFYAADLFDYLESCGAAVPLYEIGAGVALGRIVGDDALFGRHLTPLEEEAAYYVCQRESQYSETRVYCVLQRCREFQIDGLVHSNLMGCPIYLGSAKIVADMAEQELGIPSTSISVRCHDSEQFNETQVKGQLQDFVNLCISRKAEREGKTRPPT